MKIAYCILILTSTLLAAACTSKLSSEQYIRAMTEIGCNDLVESDPAAKAILQKLAITPEQIAAFRKTDRERILDAAVKIADNVAQCHHQPQK